MSSRIIQNGNPEEDVKLGDDIILSQIFAGRFLKTDASAWPADETIPSDKRQGDQCGLWSPPNSSEDSCPVTEDQTIQVGIDIRVQRESCQKLFTEATCLRKAASNKNEGRSSLYVGNHSDILIEKCDATENCKFENGLYYLTYPMGDKGHKLEIAITPPT